MKRNFFYIIAAMLLITVTIGCKKDKVTGVTLDKKEITLTIGETEILKATVHPGDATNTAVSWKSSDEAVATVVNGTVYAQEVGTATITVTTEEGNHTATCVVTVIPKEVPIEVVINGIRWATRNVDTPGTFVVKPEDAGMFYQWNRKIGWSNTDPMVNSNGGNTWDNSYPISDAWEKANDPCPSGWRVPTNAEHQSLASAGSEWTTLNGVNGRRFGSGDNSIFLPAAGYRYYENGQVNDDIGLRGHYWSGTIWQTSGHPGDSYNLGFFQNSVAHNSSAPRAYGFPVRCVAE